MLIQVHDEIVFDVPEECAHEEHWGIQRILDHMRNAVELYVPLTVSHNFGNNWKEAK